MRAVGNREVSVGCSVLRGDGITPCESGMQPPTDVLQFERDRRLARITRKCRTDIVEGRVEEQLCETHGMGFADRRSIAVISPAEISRSSGLAPRSCAIVSVRKCGSRDE